MDIVEIAPPQFDVDVALAYAGPDNFTSAPVYSRSACYMHREAADALSRAVDLAHHLGYRLRIFDALRPTEAQWRLWNHTPDPEFLAHPLRGSPHSRGVAVDVTLLDGTGAELDMGTEFDAFTPLSHHGSVEISRFAQQNRHILLGVMTTAGWDFYRNEWWHYQLFNARAFPLLDDCHLPAPLM